MLPGPVFNVELTTTARRARYYVVRVLYGLILLYIIWANYQALTWRPQAELTYNDLSQLARAAFGSFAILQVFAVLILTPVLVAGVIADERQRKTLYYLLASRLTSGEIILGKLAARMLHVAVFLTIGLPILSLLGLLGGVDPGWVLLSYVGAAATAYFVAGLSILVSVYARTVREAVVATFLLGLAWLTLPALIAGALTYASPEVAAWFQPAYEWVTASQPFPVLWQLIGSGSPSGILENLAWMAALQVGAGTALVLIAVGRLRPSFRKEGSAPRGVLARGRRLLAWRWRLMPRPACGADPMLWKELWVSRTGGLLKLAQMVMAVALGGLIGYWLVVFANDAFRELLAYGYGSTGNDSMRTQFNGFLRGTGTALFVLWTIAVAAGSAGSITSEREEDTWISLLSTPLGGPEILRAKMIGAVWGARALGAALLLIWTVGLLAGSVHPLGFLAVLIETVVFTWFTAAVGAYLSLRARTTMRAQATAILLLFVLNGGYTMCCLPFRPDTMLVAAGCTPFIEAVSLMSFEDMRNVLSAGATAPGRSHQELAETVLACIIGVIGYGVGAALMTLATLGDFDRLIDRPRRPGEYPIDVDDAIREPAKEAGPQFGDDLA